MVVGGQRHSLALYPRERDPVPILQEAGWSTVSVWTGEENLVSAGIQSLDRPTPSKSLYQLHYHDPLL